MPLQETSGAASYDAFGGGAAAVPQYIEDVFSTYLYAGTGATQTITNGIDLSTKGGLVWQKDRSQGTGYHHILQDTARGATNCLFTNLNNAQSQDSAGTGFVFNNNGFTIGTSNVKVNASGDNYTSWTFRKQPKFFDVVTYTGDGTSNRQIAHNLGSVPGFIIVKSTSATWDWRCYHRSLGATKYIDLNLTDAASTASTPWSDTAPTSTNFTVGSAGSNNASGGTYVAYLFAHDAGGFGLTGTDNVISCGSFTTNASGVASVTLGYEPQWIFAKASSTTGGWLMYDSMRGLANGGVSNEWQELVANSSGAESAAGVPNGGPTATGFITGGFQSSQTYIYIAIRRGPMKVPTNGTSVFAPVTYTGTNVDNRLVNTGILTDMTMARIRTATSTGGFYTADRLRGNASLATALTAIENTDADSFMTPTVGYGGPFSAMNGFGVGNDVTRQLNQSSTSQLAYAFQRAPSFFDEVCYTGNGTAGRTVTHNLGVAPELMIVRSNSNAANWEVYAAPLGATQYLRLDQNVAAAVYSDFWNNTAPTSSVFTVGGDTDVNGSGYSIVAYLFATCAGVSKVGSYTGNGSTQTINCGFTSGARFVLIKRTDSTGDWYVYDTARGMTTVTDPYLLLNSTAAESASLGSVTTSSTGFDLNAGILAAINTNGASYIFLAIA